MWCGCGGRDRAGRSVGRRRAGAASRAQGGGGIKHQLSQAPHPCPAGLYASTQMQPCTFEDGRVRMTGVFAPSSTGSPDARQQRTARTGSHAQLLPSHSCNGRVEQGSQVAFHCTRFCMPMGVLAVGVRWRRQFGAPSPTFLRPGCNNHNDSQVQAGQCSGTHNAWAYSKCAALLSSACLPDPQCSLIVNAMTVSWP